MKNIKTWPEVIFLQLGEEDVTPDYSSVKDYEITWCVDSIGQQDVKYIRADLVNRRKRK